MLATGQVSLLGFMYAWGVGGFMFPLLAGKIDDKYQTFAFAYYGACILLVLAAIVTFSLKPPRHVHVSEEVATAEAA